MHNERDLLLVEGSYLVNVTDTYEQEQCRIKICV